MSAGCPKNPITGRINVYGDVCRYSLKGFVTWDQPPIIYHRKICTKCGLDITSLIDIENEKKLKPAILPRLKKRA